MKVLKGDIFIVSHLSLWEKVEPDIIKAFQDYCNYNMKLKIFPFKTNTNLNYIDIEAFQDHLLKTDIEIENIPFHDHNKLKLN